MIKCIKLKEDGDRIISQNRTAVSIFNKLKRDSFPMPVVCTQKERVEKKGTVRYHKARINLKISLMSFFTSLFFQHGSNALRIYICIPIPSSERPLTS